jgi:hypothetical protein
MSRAYSAAISSAKSFLDVLAGGVIRVRLEDVASPRHVHVPRVDRAVRAGAEVSQLRGELRRERERVALS